MKPYGCFRELASLSTSLDGTAPSTIRNHQDLQIWQTTHRSRNREVVNFKTHSGMTLASFVCALFATDTIFLFWNAATCTRIEVPVNMSARGTYVMTLREPVLPRRWIGRSYLRLLILPACLPAYLPALAWTYYVHNDTGSYLPTCPTSCLLLPVQ